MLHESTLLSTLVVSFASALFGGLVAHRLRLPPLVGYVLAGIVVGPFTLGVVADVQLAGELAEIGALLLMFGVGLHFSLRDLLAVRTIALPGAVLQLAVATALGVAMARLWGWSVGAGLVLGLALSAASPVVLRRALAAHGRLSSAAGRIAVGWLLVEDVVMVLALVLLPGIAVFRGGTPSHGTALALVGTLGLLLGKVAVCVGLMLVVGTCLVPRLLEHVARTEPRELFPMAITALALGVAWTAATLFGVSLALGAFCAGVVINASAHSHRATRDVQPLHDACTVLFFVSVGMLCDPAILLQRPLAVLAVVVIIVLGKSLAAFLLVLAWRAPLPTALTVAAGLAQIGEFSFLLAGLGTTLGILPLEGRTLILAGAVLSITLHPFLFRGAEALQRWRHLPVLADRPARYNGHRPDEPSGASACRR